MTVGRPGNKQAAVRPVVSAVLVVVLFALAGAPHVHQGPHGDHDCPACLARTVEAARTEAPDVAPVSEPLVEVVAEPFEIVPWGAPLGAIPGQSPPAIA